jgi:hypothetical protein
MPRTEKSVGVIQQVSRAATQAGQLHRPRRDRCRRTIGRGKSAVWEMPDHRYRQQDQDRDDQ